jgi:arylsulfatase A-like enzyme
VLTADHGVSPTPAEQARRNMPGGYISGDAAAVAGQYLSSRFGTGTAPAEWILGRAENTLYLNWKTVDNAHVSHSEAMRGARDAVLAAPQLHVARAWTRDELIAGAGADPIERAVANGFSQARSGDIVFVQEPYYLFRTNGTSHSTPWGYDTHVPVIFYGGKVKAASYARDIAVNDIAPTLSALLGIEPPTGSSGRVLPEIVP